ncbi:MAG: L-aminopeptidase/D-esterase-like protein [Hyphomicrobiaceae bacterium]|jgi:L-aminopeptidase/D-esterase-like protein
MSDQQHNHITDVAGISVGHAGCETLVSGVTALVFEQPAVGAVAILGGAPAGRDTECLAADRLVDRVDAIVLSGGSGFGLDAATGVQAWLREQDRGLAVGTAKVPIVPQAICFDLLNGGDKDWGRFPPYRELGYAAAIDASATNTAIGSVGGGLGATTVNFKGGIGSASGRTSYRGTVAAMILVNALGSATVGDGPHFWAGPFEEKAEFGGHGPAPVVSARDRHLIWKGGPTGATGDAPDTPPHATTIGVIATDLALTKPQAQRLAIAAHDGFARALRLTHALFDGDMLFAISTGVKLLPPGPSAQIELGGIAADCVARAIARGIFEASRPGPRYTGPQTYAEMYPRPSSE